MGESRMELVAPRHQSMVEVEVLLHLAGHTATPAHSHRNNQVMDSTPSSNGLRERERERDGGMVTLYTTLSTTQCHTAVTERGDSRPTDHVITLDLLFCTMMSEYILQYKK